MLKKIILLLISTLIILAPAGCSKKDKGQNVANSDQQVIEQNQSKDDEDKNKEEVNNSEAEKKEEVKKEEEKNSNEASNQNQSSNNNQSNNKPGNVAKPEPPKQTKPDENNQSKPSNPGETQKPETPKEPEKPEKQEPSVKDIGDKIVKEVIRGKLMPTNEEIAKETYPFDRSLVSEYIIYQAMINVRSDEIAVFKVKDTSNIAEVEKGIQKRLDQLDKIWQSYLPDQYDKVKKHIILKKDNYILFSISDDQKKAEEIFNSFFSK